MKSLVRTLQIEMEKVSEDDRERLAWINEQCEDLMEQSPHSTLELSALYHIHRKIENGTYHE